jgi:hypothetical protein
VVRQLLTKTDETDLVRVTITPRNETHDYRFQFDKYVSPWLNKTNKQGLMTDFNNDGTTVSFKVSASAVSNLKYLKLSDYFEVTAS